MADIGEIVNKLKKGLYWLNGEYTGSKYMRVFRSKKDKRIELYFPFDDLNSGGTDPELMATITLKGSNGKTAGEVKFYHIQHTKFRRGFEKKLKPLIDIILEYDMSTNVIGEFASANDRFFKSRN